MKNPFKNKVKEAIELIASENRAALKEQLFSEGIITLENPQSQIKQLYIKDGRLYAIAPVDAAIVNKAIQQESFWRAEQSRGVIESYE